MSLLKIQLTLSENFAKAAKSMQSFGGGAKMARQEFAKARTDLKNLETTARQLRSFEALKAKSLRNADALKEAQDRAQALGRAMSATETATAGATKRFEAARRRVAALKEQQAEQRAELGRLSTKLADAGLKTNRLGDAQRKVAGRIAKANSELTKNAAVLDRVRRRQERLTDAENKYNECLRRRANLAITGAAGVATGRQIFRTGSDFLTPGLDFNAAMSRVGAVARIDRATEEFQNLTGLARELGASTSFSATEAADGMGYLAMAGFETNQILAAMPGLLDLSKAGATELGRTADIASNILSGFGLQAQDMGRVGDVLTATFTRSNVNLEMLGSTMEYVAPIAKTLGTSIEDASAMAGLLGNVGIQGQKAGTALRAMHNRLAAPTRMARDAMADIGLRVKDAAGNMRPMVDIMAEIATKTERMGTAQRMAIFKDLAGEEAGAAMAELVEKGGAGGIVQFADILRNAQGEAARVASFMGDDEAGDLKALSSAWQELALSVWDTVRGPFRAGVQYLTRLTRGVAEFATENPTLTRTLVLLVGGIGAVAATAGSLALTLAALAGPLAMMRRGFTILTVGLELFGIGGRGALSVFPMLFKGAKLAATGVRILTLALMANPIGLIIGGIALAAGLIIAYWDELPSFFSALWERAKAIFAVAWEWIKAGISWHPLGMIVNNWGAITEFFGEMWDGIKSVFSAGADWLLSKIDVLTKPISWLVDSVSGLFGGEEENPIRTTEAAQMRPPRRIAVASVAAVTAATPAYAGQTTPDPAPATNVTATYNITIHAGADTDADAIAKAVRKEIERIQREEAARARGRLFDD